MPTNATTSYGAVQTHAVRTVPVRGSAGDSSTLLMHETTQAYVDSVYIHVPEIDATALTYAYADTTTIRRVGAFRAATDVLGVVGDFYIISPSFISDAVVDCKVPLGGVRYGSHAQDFSTESSAYITDSYSKRVAGCSCVTYTSMDVNKAYSTYNGHPVMRVDDDCCVFA